MSEATRLRILRAAFETLREDGFAATSARAIARRGGFNQALIFYHFGTLPDLLLGVLDGVSEQRMARYEAELATVRTIGEKIEVAGALYGEDLAHGHITVVAEMVGGSLGRPDLAPEVVRRLEPWTRLVEGVIAQALDGTILDAVLDARTAARAVVALYLGLDLLEHLERDPSRAASIFDAGGRIAHLLGPFVGQGGRRRPVPTRPAKAKEVP